MTSYFTKMQFARQLFSRFLQIIVHSFCLSVKECVLILSLSSFSIQYGRKNSGKMTSYLTKMQFAKELFIRFLQMIVQFLRINIRESVLVLSSYSIQDERQNGGKMTSYFTKMPFAKELVCRFWQIMVQSFGLTVREWILIFSTLLIQDGGQNGGKMTSYLTKLQFAKEVFGWFWQVMVHSFRLSPGSELRYLCHSRSKMADKMAGKWRHISLKCSLQTNYWADFTAPLQQKL